MTTVASKISTVAGFTQHLPFQRLMCLIVYRDRCEDCNSSWSQDLIVLLQVTSQSGSPDSFIVTCEPYAVTPSYTDHLHLSFYLKTIMEYDQSPADIVEPPCITTSKYSLLTLH